MELPVITRFAPSPTGHLHLGHAYSALRAHDAARAAGGRFLLRIEDLDVARCRETYAAQLMEDLVWLGITWDGAVRRQSERTEHYQQALRQLADRDLLYPCFCTRSAIAGEVRRMSSAPQGPDGPLYPGTCRALTPASRRARVAAGESHALRLDVAHSLATLPGAALFFDESGAGPAGETGRIPVQPATLGDLVLSRKDVGVSYHLAVVVDDADQSVTLVTRGDDLFAATHVQRLLQSLLGLPAPRYAHHPLIRDATGRRLAKRDRDETLLVLRAAGITPEAIRTRVGLG